MPGGEQTRPEYDESRDAPAPTTSSHPSEQTQPAPQRYSGEQKSSIGGGYGASGYDKIIALLQGLLDDQRKYHPEDSVLAAIQAAQSVSPSTNFLQALLGSLAMETGQTFDPYSYGDSNYYGVNGPTSFGVNQYHFAPGTSTAGSRFASRYGVNNVFDPYLAAKYRAEYSLPVYNELGGDAAYSADPVSFLRQFQSQSQGSVVPSEETAYSALAFIMQLLEGGGQFASSRSGMLGR